jgi:flavin-binding protein dodecin
MANWLAGREACKRAAKIEGADSDVLLDRLIADASKRFEADTNRLFIPRVLTRYYDYDRPHKLWLDADLLTVTSLYKKSQDTTPVEIVAADYYLEPVNDGPPYELIEIDLASNTTFEPGDNTSQRSIKIIGSWGYSADTAAAGALAEADDGSETALEVTDASLIDVGDTILIGTEQMFVTAKGTLDTATNTAVTLTADKAITSVTVGDGTKVKAGEIILINSERFLVESVAGNVLATVRAYDGSTLAAHADAQDVYAYRTLTVTRANNGTTAAAHDTAAAIVKYTPPADVVEQIVDEVIAAWAQQQSAWGRVIGVGEGGGSIAFSGRQLGERRRQLVTSYMRPRLLP